MINEFGEIIKTEEIESIRDRVMKLSPENIDLLWSKCGWIDSEKKYSRALPKEKIANIKVNKEMSLQYVTALLLETPKLEILNNLSEVEKI